jgi:hypothetical protein
MTFTVQVSTGSRSTQDERLRGEVQHDVGRRFGNGARNALGIAYVENSVVYVGREAKLVEKRRLGVWLQSNACDARTGVGQP